MLSPSSNYLKAKREKEGEKKEKTKTELKQEWNKSNAKQKSRLSFTVSYFFLFDKRQQNWSEMNTDRHKS